VLTTGGQRRNGQRLWPHVARLAGLAIVVVELRQVLLGEPVTDTLLLLAAGLFGLPWAIRDRSGS
jgi:hypothetical protein